MSGIIAAPSPRLNRILQPTHPFDTDRAEAIVLGAVLAGRDLDLSPGHFTSPTRAAVFTFLSARSREDRRAFERRLAVQIENDDAAELADAMSGAPSREAVVPVMLRDVYTHRCDPPEWVAEAIASLCEALIRRLLLAVAGDLAHAAADGIPIGFALARCRRALNGVDRMKPAPCQRGAA